MAEVNMNINNAARTNMNDIRNPAVRPSLQSQRQDQDRDRTRIEEERGEENKAPAYENIVSVSEDGDTVQASPEGMNELKEEAIGTVVARNAGTDGAGTAQTEQTTEEEEDVAAIREDERQKEQAYDPVEEARKEAERRAQIREDIRLEEEKAEELEEAAQKAPVREEAREEEREELASAQITSFAGYTDTQLRSLYLSGEITRADYDAEMQNRQEVKEEQIETVKEDNNQFAREMNTYNALLEEGRRDELELERAYAEGANQNTEPAQRVDIIRQLQDFAITT